jgi:hypothetical protein
MKKRCCIYSPLLKEIDFCPLPTIHFHCQEPSRGAPEILIYILLSTRPSLGTHIMAGGSSTSTSGYASRRDIAKFSGNPLRPQRYEQGTETIIDHDSAEAEVWLYHNRHLSQEYRSSQSSRAETKRLLRLLEDSELKLEESRRETLVLKRESDNALLHIHQLENESAMQVEELKRSRSTLEDSSRSKANLQALAESEVC